MTSFAHEHSLKHQALSLMVDPGGANLDGDAKLAEAESNRERERERVHDCERGAEPCSGEGARPSHRRQKKKSTIQ